LTEITVSIGELYWILFGIWLYGALSFIFGITITTFLWNGLKCKKGKKDEKQNTLDNNNSGN